MGRLKTEVYDDHNWYSQAKYCREGVVYCLHDYKHGICKISSSVNDKDIGKSYMANYPFELEIHTIHVESQYHGLRYVLWVLDDFKVKGGWFEIELHQFLKLESKISEVTNEVLNRYRSTPEYHRSEVMRKWEEERRRREAMPYQCEHCMEKFDEEQDVISHVKECEDRGRKRPKYRDTSGRFDVINTITSPIKKQAE